MISGTTSSCYSLPIHGGGGSGGGGIHEVQNLPETNSSSFLFNLSVLKDKVDHIQSFVSIWMSPESPQSAVALPTMANLIQEIIVTASSMMFSCQQMAIGSPTAFDLNNQRSKMSAEIVNAGSRGGVVRGFLSHQLDDEWCGNHHNQYSNSNEELGRRIDGGCRPETTEKREIIDGDKYDLVELDAADLLAKYTHYCQICGKGFKRDANLRMHMRAHGDEYKSSAALSNPLKNNPDYGGESTAATKLPRKYSCPQEGCRWNKNHPKFQPLKSMICIKNHFKRSHCPKMYVCKRCNRKQFSVLSDLRTHEKHCGDLKWQCSCGTTFSRKDKLMGHLALFVGHSPAVNSTAAASGSQNSAQLGES